LLHSPASKSMSLPAEPSFDFVGWTGFTALPLFSNLLRCDSVTGAMSGGLFALWASWLSMKDFSLSLRSEFRCVLPTLKIPPRPPWLMCAYVEKLDEQRRFRCVEWYCVSSLELRSNVGNDTGVMEYWLYIGEVTVNLYDDGEVLSYKAVCVCGRNGEYLKPEGILEVFRAGRHPGSFLSLQNQSS